MRKVVGAALIAGMVTAFTQFGGASEPVSGDASIARQALTLGKVAGCDRFQVAETDAFLKRIGVVCEDGRSHWISQEGPLKVDGQTV